MTPPVDEPRTNFYKKMDELEKQKHTANKTYSQLESLIEILQDRYCTNDTIKEALLYLLNKEKDRKKLQQEHDMAIAAQYRNEMYEMRKRYNELE